MAMRWIAGGVVCIALTAGLASATPDKLQPMLSFTIAAGVSDSGFTPLGGGICLGNRRVTDPNADGGIAWSPDGSRVAFYRQTGTLTADVFVAHADGSHLRNLTKGSAQFSVVPDWSPDGSRIVYVASDPDVERLVTIRPDGSGRETIPGTAVDPSDQLDGPQWSPDGNLIGFTLTDGIHVIRPDGSQGRLLMPDAYGFDWSPDGRRIVFTRDRDLALAGSDGSGVTFVTRTPKLHEGAAHWSPDGSRMVYVSVDETDPKVEQGPGDHMYLADANGRNSRDLRGPRGVGAWTPVWRPAAPSPKGTRPCALLGTPGRDVLVGTAKGDLILAGRGNDVVRGRGGNDILVGDVPYARRRGKDRLYGGPGRDFVDSYDGRRDLVNGGPGRDRGIFDRHDRVRSIEKYG
jgi:RTX calcium-binding nonapeptide repeat (4 copies)/WD40-like Beta Propeller Repeat